MEKQTNTENRHTRGQGGALPRWSENGSRLIQLYYRFINQLSVLLPYRVPVFYRLTSHHLYSTRALRKLRATL